MRFDYEDPTSQVLQSISNPIRRSIVQVLASKREPFVFSELMRECGLNPNFDAGHFSYHLSVLMDQNIVIKKENRYIMTEPGFKLSTIIKTLDKECDFFLKKEDKPDDEVVDFEVKWAKKKEWEKYGIAGDLKEAAQRQRLSKDEEEKMWKFRLKEEIIVALRHEETLGWMRVHAGIGADLKERRLLTPIRNIASIDDIILFAAGKERAQVARKMIEMFLTEAEKKDATLVTANIDAEDEEVVSAFKSCGFERTGINYNMSKKL